MALSVRVSQPLGRDHLTSEILSEIRGWRDRWDCQRGLRCRSWPGLPAKRVWTFGTRPYGAPDLPGTPDLPRSCPGLRTTARTRRILRSRRVRAVVRRP